MSDELADALLEKEWRSYFPDWDKTTHEQKMAAFSRFCSQVWSIRHPERGRIKFEMTDAQIEVIDVWMSERYSIALKARQVGFSTLAAAFSFWLAFGYSDRAIIMLSKTERDAMKLLAKSKYGYRFVPEWMKIYYRAPVVDSNQTMMRFTNESYIESLPSASDPARGEAVFLVIVDEMAFLPNSDEAWASIEPIADVGGRVIMLGTANGEGNLFHKLWVGARSPWGNSTNRFVGIFHNWRAAAGRDDNWYAVKKADLPEWQLAQEYPDNPDEAFLKSGRPVFNTEKLRKIEILPPDARGYLRVLPGNDMELVEDGGNLAVWKHPETDHKYVMGVDVAEGLEFGDYSSIHVISANTREVVAHWHGHIEPDLLGSDVCAKLGKYYNNALAMVESNNHGLTTLVALRDARYFPIYRRRRFTQRKKVITEAMGWATTSITKPLVIDELAKELRDFGITLYDESTVAELRSYVREGNGKMHGSPHDDRVMSLAIATKGLDFIFLKEYKYKPVPGPGTFGWWLKHTKWTDDDDDDAVHYMGEHAVRAS